MGSLKVSVSIEVAIPKVQGTKAGKYDSKFMSMVFFISGSNSFRTSLERKINAVGTKFYRAIQIAQITHKQVVLMGTIHTKRKDIYRFDWVGATTHRFIISGGYFDSDKKKGEVYFRYITPILKKTYQHDHTTGLLKLYDVKK